MGVFRKPFHRGPRSRRRQVVATYAAPPPVVSTVVRRRKVPDHVYRRPDLTIYSRSWRRAFGIPVTTFVAAPPPTRGRRPVPDHVRFRPDLTEYSRRRRFVLRKTVAASGPEVCSLEFEIEERVPLPFELDSPSQSLGLRDPLDFRLVECRNEV